MDAIIKQYDPPQTMADLRQAAFARAMDVGKRIEAAILGKYTAGEPLTWPTQEREARIVKDGGEIPEGSLLLILAARRGLTPLAMADLILEKAAYFIAVVAAGQELRRAAEGLLSPTLDTPEALAAAVEALRQVAAQKAAALNLPPP